MEADAAVGVQPATPEVAPPEITLRPFELSDIDDFMTWASDQRVTRFSQRGPFAVKEDALDYLKNRVMPHPWHRALCLENRPVGSISVQPGGDRFRASLGYRVAYRHWGRGVATAAVKKAAAQVFGESPHLERLEAVVDVQNPASQRVLEKAGFKREGVLRKYLLLRGPPIDVVMCSFVRSVIGVEE